MLHVTEKSDIHVELVPTIGLCVLIADARIGLETGRDGCVLHLHRGDQGLPSTPRGPLPFTFNLVSKVPINLIAQLAQQLKKARHLVICRR